jgi:hypothetical protein
MAVKYDDLGLSRHGDIREQGVQRPAPDEVALEA